MISKNWLTKQRIFDFDEVRILHATDEEIERFVIQVGNDTDVVRKSKQKAIRCLIASDCGISENSVRVLKHILGQIEVI